MILIHESGYLVFRIAIVEPLWNRTPLCTTEVEPTLLFQQLEMRNPSIPIPWNEDTSMEPIYFNLMKWGHLCIPSISAPWNEDTSVYNGTHSVSTPWNEDTFVYSGTYSVIPTPRNKDTSLIL